MKLLFLTTAEMPELLPYDQTVIQQLHTFKVQVDIMIWEKLSTTPLEQLTPYKAIIIRTCWNYYKKPEVFGRLLDFCSSHNLPLLNPADIVRWNMDKRYLLDLEKEGIELIPTAFVFEHDPSVFSTSVNRGWQKLVIKPMISGGSYHTFVIDKEDESGFDKILGTYYKNRPYMLQEFIPEISSGEVSTLRFANGFTYSIAKVPKKGDYRVQFTYGGTYHIEKVHPQIATLCDQIAERFQGRLLYQRVDGVWRNNRFLLMEVELIEPDLYLGHHAEALSRWVKNLAELDR